MKRKLEDRGITNIPHFAPLYKFDVIKKLGYEVEKIEKSCPVAEDAFSNRFTHLPLYGLSGEQLKFMADSVLEAIGEMQEGK